MVSLGAIAPTNQAGSGGPPLQVIRIALTARLTHCKLRLVDPAPRLCPACRLFKRITRRPVRELASICCAVSDAAERFCLLELSLRPFALVY